MDVYRTTARSVHVMALMDTYSVCVEILGEQYFKQIAKAYVRSNGSIDPNMNEYGADFSEFLNKLCAERDELIGYEYLPDLARLEWCSQAAYYAQDNVEFDFSLLEQKYAYLGDQVAFKLQASVQPLCSAYPIHQIWQAHKDKQVINEIEIQQGVQFVCVYREEYAVRVSAVSEEIFLLLGLIEENRTLAEIAERFANRYNLDGVLRMVMQNNWIRV